MSTCGNGRRSRACTSETGRSALPSGASLRGTRNTGVPYSCSWACRRGHVNERAKRGSGAVVGFRSGCRTCLGSGGGLLPRAEGICRGELPSQAGARGRSGSRSRRDGPGHEQGCSQRGSSCRPSSADVRRLHGLPRPRSDERSSPASALPGGPCSREEQVEVFQLAGWASRGPTQRGTAVRRSVIWSLDCEEPDMTTNTARTAVRHELNSHLSSALDDYTAYSATPVAHA